MISPLYKEKRPARSEFVPIRGLRYHVQRWGPETTADTAGALPPLVLVHGWMDVAASYQFMMDAFSEAFATGRSVIAPDWRGFGQTDAGTTDNFWFPDYLADLDFLLDHCCPGQPVDLVGHSMGGNIAMTYAGVRPGRIRRLVNLEGFGLAATRPSQAPGRYAQWMDQLKSLQRGDLGLKGYDSMEGVAQRLMKTSFGGNGEGSVNGTLRLVFIGEGPAAAAATAPGSDCFSARHSGTSSESATLSSSKPV